MPKPLPTINKNAIDVHQISVSFNSTAILEDISFAVKNGSICAIIGPNGSGKTTLLKAILGLLKPQTGSVLFWGKNVEQTRGRIGYVPQRFNFDVRFPITVREFISLTRQRSVPKSRIEEVVQEVGLTPIILKKQLGELSGGQLQRILIAQALFLSPDLLIMDEPAAGIDIMGGKLFHDILLHLNRDHNTTIVIVSHDMAFVSKIVDHVICINKTLVCADPPKIALTEKNLKKLFEDAELSRHAHGIH